MHYRHHKNLTKNLREIRIRLRTHIYSRRKHASRSPANIKQTCRCPPKKFLNQRGQFTECRFTLSLLCRTRRRSTCRWTSINTFARETRNPRNFKLAYRGFFDSRDGGTLITLKYNNSTRFAGEQGSVTSESIVVPRGRVDITCFRAIQNA